MTEDNYNYRTSQIMLRNRFPGDGPFRIPIIPKSDFSEVEFRDLRLIGFDRTRIEDEKNLDWMVHFFLYDYKFERVWKEPDRDIERLRRYRAVLSPDFSIYLEMNPTIQLYNTFRNRWCGAYFQSKGMRVIPTVNWGDESTFDFCFLGIPKGSTVAVSTYMVSEHGNHSDQKEFFLKGYNEMLRRVEPERIICYNTPFPEMEGNIVFVDYELSSWKYQGQLEAAPLSPFAKDIAGGLPLPENSGIVIKQGTIIHDRAEKGSGSAYGGKWRPNPNKPTDARFIGEPGEVKQTVMKNGVIYETKIGEDGRAIMERHHTDHNQPWAHSNPHDHMIKWDNPSGFPDPQSPTNYWDDVPEFKRKEGAFDMNRVDLSKVPNDEDRFESISDFKNCMRWHGEVVFEWKGMIYSITPRENGDICISHSCMQSTETAYRTADALLEYKVGDDRLRDVIKNVRILERSI